MERHISEDINMSSSDDSCDFLNFNLKELQALNHQVSTQREHAQQRRQRIAALKSTDNLHTSDEELDVSDRDVTYKPSKEDLLSSSSDECDSLPRRSPRKKHSCTKKSRGAKTKYVARIMNNDGNIPSTSAESEFLSQSVTDNPRVSQEIVDSTSKKRKSKADRREEHKQRKQRKIDLKYAVKPGCGDVCKRKVKCKEQIQESLQKEVNERYWALQYCAQRMFLMESVQKTTPKKNTCGKKSASFRYTLKDQDGKRVEVCKSFFLGTLGYKPKNDIVITHLFKQTPSSKSPSTNLLADMRGKASKPIYSVADVQAHIESYNPTVSHYRRKHAPLRRYLPPEITIRQMHKDYAQKTQSKISYPHFQKIFRSMNISMTLLGHEQCETCSKSELHKQNCTCEEVCDISEITLHKKKYRAARKEYKQDSVMDDKLVMSVDLQKVVMLPRMDEFKAAIFTRRLTTFNETFAAVSKGRPNFAALWHEAISGRKDEDITSTFHRFFIEVRDEIEIVLWLDNCSGQNKNWTLFSMLVVLVNSDEIQTNKITLKFFEPGHTFMSADACHSKIESEMKRLGKVYDFSDFVSCVRKAKCIPIIMKPQDFRAWQSGVSHHTLNKLPERPKLASMVQVVFQRGSENLLYKTSFAGDEKELRFLKNSFTLQIEPNSRSQPRGVHPSKKNDIVNKLLPLMPTSRQVFWNNLSVNACSKDLAIDYE